MDELYLRCDNRHTGVEVLLGPAAESAKQVNEVLSLSVLDDRTVSDSETEKNKNKIHKSATKYEIQ